MRDQHVPAIGPYYWPTLAAASLFGRVTGNFLVPQMEAWNVGAFYLPLLVAGLGIILFIEARDERSTVRWYWLAVVIAPALANNLADVGFAYLGVRRVWICAVLLVLLVVSQLAFQSDATRVVALRLQLRLKPAVPLTDASYWIAMILSGSAGTLASDFLTLGLSIDLRTVFIILLLSLAAIAAVRHWTKVNRAWAYWTLVFATNALATAVGDVLEVDPQFGLGLLRSAILSGLVLSILLLIAWRNDPETRRDR